MKGSKKCSSSEVNCKVLFNQIFHLCLSYKMTSTLQKIIRDQYLTSILTLYCSSVNGMSSSTASLLFVSSSSKRLTVDGATESFRLRQKHTHTKLHFILNWRQSLNRISLYKCLKPNQMSVTANINCNICFRISDTSNR